MPPEAAEAVVEKPNDAAKAAVATGGTGAARPNGQGGGTGVETGATEQKPAKGAGSVLDTGGEGGAGEQQQADWREELAGGDAEALKVLQRFKSAQDFYKSYDSGQKKIRSGPKAPTLGENPSEEEVKEYRAALGIPDDPKGYKIDLPKGFELGEADKPTVDAFLKAAHDGHLPPGAVNVAMKWYAQHAAEQAQARHDADVTAKSEAEEALRGEWGGDYKRNIQGLGNFIEALPEEIGDALLTARDAQGQRLFNNPAVLKWFADLALEANPAATFVASDGSGKGMASRKAEIEKVMSADMNAYWKDAAMQKEYADILAREERAAGKGRKAG